MREQRAAQRQPNAPDEMAAWRLLTDSRMANEATRVNEGKFASGHPKAKQR